jgi:hypothetical protein
MAKATKKTPATPERLRELSLANIAEVLEGKREIDDTAGLAMKFLNYESRQTALRHGRAKLAFAMVRQLADPALVRKYVETTEPEIKKLG